MNTNQIQTWLWWVWSHSWEKGQKKVQGKWGCLIQVRKRIVNLLWFATSQRWVVPGEQKDGKSDLVGRLGTRFLPFLSEMVQIQTVGKTCLENRNSVGWFPYYLLTSQQSALLPGSSEGKESICNAGDPGSIPGSGRSSGEGNGYSLQYSCLEKPTNREAWQAAVNGVTKSQMPLSD